MPIVFIRAVILYALIVFSVRLMGKRQIGELQPSELVTAILVSNIATLPIEDTGIPLMMGIIPILTLVCLDVLMSAASLKSRRIRRLVSGSPKIIVRDGIIDQRQLRELRFSVDDILESLREQNIFDISEVQFAVVETTGKISIYPKFQYRPAEKGDVTKKQPSENPPFLIIDDGSLIDGALDEAELNKHWLESTLRTEKCAVSDVFLLTADRHGKYTLIKKDYGKNGKS